jgi:hypothetical protein
MRACLPRAVALPGSGGPDTGFSPWSCVMRNLLLTREEVCIDGGSASSSCCCFSAWGVSDDDWAYVPVLLAVMLGRDSQ